MMVMEPPPTSMKISLVMMWWCRQMIWNSLPRPGQHLIVILAWRHRCHWIWSNTVYRCVAVSCKKMLTNQRTRKMKWAWNRKRKAKVLKKIVQRRRKTSCANSPNNCITDTSPRYLNKRTYNPIFPLTSRILAAKKTSTRCQNYCRTSSSSKSDIKTVNLQNIKRRSAQKIWRCLKKYTSVHTIREELLWLEISSPQIKPIKAILSAPRATQGSPLAFLITIPLKAS